MGPKFLFFFLIRSLPPFSFPSLHLSPLGGLRARLHSSSSVPNFLKFQFLAPVQENDCPVTKSRYTHIHQIIVHVSVKQWSQCFIYSCNWFYACVLYIYVYIQYTPTCLIFFRAYRVNVCMCVCLFVFAVMLQLCPHQVQHMRWEKALCVVTVTPGGSRSSCGSLLPRKTQKPVVRKTNCWSSLIKGLVTFFCCSFQAFLRIIIPDNKRENPRLTSAGKA